MILVNEHDDYASVTAAEDWTIVDWDPHFDADYDVWRDQEVRFSRVLAIIATVAALLLGCLIGRSIA